MAVGNMFRQRRDLSGKRRSPGTLPMFQTNQYAQSPLSAAPAQSAGGLSRSPALAALNPLTGGLQGMMMQGLGRAQSLTGRQQSPPTSGMYADGVMDREFGRSVDMGNARMAPVFGSAGQAGAVSRSYPNVMGRSMANTVNSYVGANPIAMTPQDKFNTAQAAAQRFMGGGAASDPTGLGRRFGPGSPLTSGPPQVTDAQRQQASQDYLRSVDPRAALDRNYRGSFARQMPDGQMAYTNRLGALEDYVRANPMDTAAQAALRAEQDNATRRSEITQNRLEAFKAEHGGMDARQFRRSQRDEARTEKQFRQAVEAGLNPMSPQAQALFPNQVAKVRSEMNGTTARNPMTAAFEPGAPDNIENRQARARVRSTLVAGDPNTGAQPSPTLVAFGVTEDATPDQFVRAVADGMGDVDLVGDGARDVFNFAKTFGPTEDGKSPFKNSPEMNKLWNMPADASQEDIDRWASDYKKALQRVRYFNHGESDPTLQPKKPWGPPDFRPRSVSGLLDHIRRQGGSTGSF